MQYGLLGRKLAHSYSPQIHKFFGNYAYSLLELEPESLTSFFAEKNFLGINVTIPYKKTALRYCDELTESARQTGAVNTIINQNGRLLGHNTDCSGFRFMLEKSGLTVKDKKVLVLGSGGASVTARFVLNEEGANTVVISRNGENNYTNLIRHADAALIINCTPVGMYPNNGCSPLSLDAFPALEGVLDMIYNPAKTALLMKAENRGLIALNGLWMLIAQAKESAQFFTGKAFPDTIIHEIYRTISITTQNIALIGMPGCGKTEVGKALAHMLKRELLDSDQAICQKEGCSIADIFEHSGENGFRTIETEVLSQLSKGSGAIIATGGGCVTRPENLPLLRQNSVIIWLRRDIARLAKEGRPLSVAADLKEMYEIRRPLYERFADFSVDNTGTPAETASRILNLLKGMNHENTGY